MVRGVRAVVGLIEEEIIIETIPEYASLFKKFVESGAIFKAQSHSTISRWGTPKVTSLALKLQEKQESLYQAFIDETFGVDEHIPSRYDDFVDGAWRFAEYLKNHGSTSTAKMEEMK